MALRWLNEKKTVSRDLTNFDVGDARKIRNKKRDVENAMFEYLWKMLMQKIALTAKTSWELTYCVPDKVPGLPPYDAVLVARRMRVRLRRKGFCLKQYEGDEDSPVLFVSWREEKKTPSKPAVPPLDPSIQGLYEMARQIAINEQCGYS